MSLPKTYVSGFHNEEEVKSMPYKRLGETDMEVSRLSLGGAAFSSLYGGLNDEEVIGTIKEAFQSGINYIDTAPYYGEGHSETLVGKGLKNVPREAFYISTKVGRYTCKYETMFDYSREKIHSRFETSLQLLGVKYVDIAVVHDVEFADIDQVLNEALPAVEELVKSGKVRYIAISGYPVSRLWEVVQKSKVKIDIVLSYSRETLIDTTLSKYADKFKSKGVGIINAAPLAMQMLTNKGPEVWHPANDDIKKLCLNASQYCKEKGVELGLLAIYHSMVKDEYATCLVGCNSKKLLKSNLNLVFQGLSQLEKDVLKHIKEKYFTLKEDLHWEGVEVSAYKKYMESIKK